MSGESIAKLILDSMESGNSETGNTVMGMAFRDAIQRQQELERREEKEGITDEERQEIEKIRFLKICEDNGDLGWMEYSSWNLFNADFKEVFTREVNPLIWGALYFQYSKVLLMEEVLWSFLSPACSLYDLVCGKVHKLVYINSEGSIYDELNNLEFKDLVQEFNNRIVRAIGVCNKKVYIKEFRGGK